MREGIKGKKKTYRIENVNGFLRGLAFPATIASDKETLDSRF